LAAIWLLTLMQSPSGRSWPRHRVFVMSSSAGTTSQWAVTLNDGSVIKVWADAVNGLSDEDGGDYEFVCLREIDPSECPSGFDAIGTTAEGLVQGWDLVARFPRASVSDIESG